MAVTVAPLIEQVINAFTQGILKIPIDPIKFKFSQYREATNFLDSKTRGGKVVVTIS